MNSIVWQILDEMRGGKTGLNSVVFEHVLENSPKPKCLLRERTMNFPRRRDG
jgi:hypothetical protein